MSKENAKSRLKESLKRFKEDATKTGWEDDEVDEKVAEVFENFPWYEFSERKKKRTCISKIWIFFVYSFIMYLALGAVLQRNKRIKKNINDYIFDMHIPYHQNRLLRYLTLPIYRLYDLSKFHGSECLIHNPFLEKEVLKCEFCENVTSIGIETNAVDIMEKVTNNEIFTLHKVAGYYNHSIQFDDIKNLFVSHGWNMDESICKIFLNEQFAKMSEFFKLTEQEVNERNLTIGWRNCDAYGTRFYRKLFKRPAFISNVSEILLEKDMYLLQPGRNISFDKIGGETVYVFQVQGESEFSFRSPEVCHSDCSKVPLSASLKTGQIVVFPNAEWVTTVRSVGEQLTILYLSTFDN